MHTHAKTSTHRSCLVIRTTLLVISVRFRALCWQEGRQSGDAEWIASRGEGGGLSASTGPAQTTSSSEAQAASRLVGVPLGVFQPGGSLALCVAAVVERSGDASVLVGGATVCRLSARGRGALCAAAVSATTGVLRAAKTFVLCGPGESAEVVNWLADLPDGTVVAIAAGGGNKKDGALDAGLAEAVAGLVGHDADPDIESTNSSTPEEGNKSAAVFTLVGWKGKGDGPWEWARRQHQNTAGGNGDGGRCALYTELLLTPPLLAADHVATPKLVELKDKLCLCPLRSVPGDDSVQTPPAPARGVCRRTGEPTVSVGPAIDLVDCPGWTTILQAPEEKATAPDGTEKKDPQPHAAWTVTAVYPAVGASHEDTDEFDDSPAG